MGLGIEEVGRLGFWQYLLAVEGWRLVHDSEAVVEAPSASEYHDMVARLGGL
jgi:hypothetical protein